MQVAQPKLVGLVDQHRVGVGDVDARLDDRGGHEHVVGPVDEARHDVFQFLAVHLAVADANARVGHQPLDHARHFLDVAHPVVDEVGLASPAQFVGDGVADGLLVEAGQDGVHRVAVGRRRADDAQVARAHQGELERPGDGGGRQRQRVDVGLEGLQLVLDADPKLLFFVDDKQAQLFELDALPHQGVRADQDVGFP